MIVKPPTNINTIHHTLPTVFLAGSIEMDTAERWQDKTAEQLSKAGYLVFNPRRDEWDNTLEQSYENPNFFQQVNWEIDAMTIADLVVFYFDKNTKSVVTMLELGYMIGKNPQKVGVVCPDGYFRKGNVDIMCYKAGVLQFNSLDKMIEALITCREKAIKVENENKN